MDTQIQIFYDQHEKVFNKTYSGKIELEGIFRSWTKIFNDQTIPPRTQKFMIDYSNADFSFEPAIADLITSFYQSNDHVFGNAKIAIVAKKPEHVVIPLIVKNNQRDFTVEVFYTQDAAKQWLRLN